MKSLLGLLLLSSLLSADNTGYIVYVTESSPIYAMGYSDVQIGSTSEYVDGRVKQVPVYQRIEEPRLIGYKSCGSIGGEYVCTTTRTRADSFTVTDNQLGGSYNTRRDRAINYYEKPLSNKLGIKTRRWW